MLRFCLRGCFDNMRNIGPRNLEGSGRKLKWIGVASPPRANEPSHEGDRRKAPRRRGSRGFRRGAAPSHQLTGRLRMVEARWVRVGAAGGTLRRPPERRFDSRLAMKFLVRRSPLAALFAALSAMGVIACGASINAVYEGDVRFEHCMALEDEPGATPTTRKSCWDEWVAYYTYGQTRDRMDYARRRQRQLVEGGELRDDPATRNALAQRAVPEPTTVSAPPPMILTDAGVLSDGGPDGASSAQVAVPEPPAAACASPCRDAWTPCKQACTNAACEKACERKYRACMRRCF